MKKYFSYSLYHYLRFSEITFSYDVTDSVAMKIMFLTAKLIYLWLIVHNEAKLQREREREKERIGIMPNLK